MAMTLKEALLDYELEQLGAGEWAEIRVRHVHFLTRQVVPLIGDFYLEQVTFDTLRTTQLLLEAGLGSCATLVVTLQAFTDFLAWWGYDRQRAENALGLPWD